MSRIGNLGSAATFDVTEGGTIGTPSGAALDWLVGAADGWHEPARASGTR